MSAKKLHNLPQTHAEWLALAQDSDWCVETMAQKVEYKLAHFGRLFHERVGCNPKWWLHRNRMILARKWLRETGDIKETAWRLKYKQVSHFSMAFKQCYEITLSEFLRSYRHFGE